MFFLLFALQVACSKKKISNTVKNNTVIQEKKASGICSSPNTKISQNGTCVCANSNFYGNPNSPKGCWTCDVKCHRNGICVEPNKCECKKSYFGDGIIACKRPKPQISAFSPNKCNYENTEIYFATQKVKFFKPEEVFCRFGSFISYGEVINRTYFKCDCPSLRNGIYDSGISFDNEDWSSLVQIEFDQESSYVFSIYTYIIMSSLVISFISAILWYRRLLLSDSRNDAIEVLPLNKWYMHQIQQEIGEENRIIDFFSHIITG